MVYSEISSFSDTDLIYIQQPKNIDDRVGKVSVLMQYVQENLDTGMLNIKGDWRSEWVVGTNYTKNDIFKDTPNASVYIVLEDHQSTDIATDETLGRIEKLVEGTAISEPQINTGAVTEDKIAAGAVVTIKIADGSVTLAKIQNISDLTVLGNTSGVSAAPSEISIVTDATLVAGNNNDLVGKAAIKAYFDNNRPLADGEVTKQNLEDIANMKVLGNTSGATAAPQEINISSDGSFASSGDNDLVRKKSIEEFVLAQSESTAGFTPTAYAGEESITFPNGLIFKQGTQTGNGVVTFGTAFPTAVVTAQVTTGPTVSGSGVECTVQALSVSSVTLWTNNGGHPMYWHVWGY